MIIILVRFMQIGCTREDWQIYHKALAKQRSVAVRGRRMLIPLPPYSTNRNNFNNNARGLVFWNSEKFSNSRSKIPILIIRIDSKNNCAYDRLGMLLMCVSCILYYHYFSKMIQPRVCGRHYSSLLFLKVT